MSQGDGAGGMSRTRRAGAALGLRYLSTAISLAIALVSTPLLLEWLGPTRYGMFRVSLDYLGYASLLEFGIGGVLMARFAKAYAAGDRGATVGLIRNGSRAYLRTGGFAAALILGLVVAAPWLVRIPEDGGSALTDELRIGLLVALVGVAWWPLAPLQNLAYAEQRGYHAQIATILQSLTTVGVALWLARTTGHLAGQFGAVVIGAGVFYLYLAWDALRRYPELLSRSAGAGVVVEPDRAPATATMMFLYAACTQLSVNSDSIVVGLVLGADAVVPFTLTQRLLLIVDLQILAIGAVTWSVLSEYLHRGEPGVFHRRLTSLTRLTAVFGFALLVPTAAATPAFVRLWVGPAGYGGTALTAATFGCTALHGLIALWAGPLVGMGRVRAVLPVMLVGLAVNLTTSVAATAWLGVCGPAIGTLANYAGVSAWWLPFVLRREFGTPLRPLFRAVFYPLALAIPYTVGLFAFAEAFPPDELDLPRWGRWAVLAGAMAAASSGYLILGWLLVLPREEREELRRRVFRR
jgi:O-antigen/teichoic acid export membrane protein